MNEVGKLSSPDNELIYLIATSREPVSRNDLARLTGLSKMTISRHVAALVERGILTETTERISEQSMGRIPASLSLSASFPCICGILIKRSYVQTVLTDLSGKIIDMAKHYNEPDMNAEKLKRLLRKQYDEVTKGAKRHILGCGIAAIGPLDSNTGRILKPADFYGISDFPVVEIMREHTGLPVYLLHDASAGALAEKIYGNGMNYDNYIYLHIAEGIGLGFIQNGQLFCEMYGRSGEIGHTSINFNGPKCSCGNNGCLEVYASVQRMREKIQELLPYSSDSQFRRIKNPSWENIVELADSGDMIATIALDEFCTYLAYAIGNVLNLINFSIIVIGYDSKKSSDVVTRMLQAKMKNFHSAAERGVKVISAYFDNSPLMGAAAVVANEVFQQNSLFCHEKKKIPLDYLVTKYSKNDTNDSRKRMTYGRSEPKTRQNIQKI